MVTSRAALSRSISRLRMASFSNSLTIHHGFFQNSKCYLSLLFSNKLSFPRRSATSPSRVAIAASRSWNTFYQRLYSDSYFTFSLYSFSLSRSPSSKFWLLQKKSQPVYGQWTSVQVTQGVPPSPWPGQTPPRKLCTSPSSRPTLLHTWKLLCSCQRFTYYVPYTPGSYHLFLSAAMSSLRSSISGKPPAKASFACCRSRTLSMQPIILLLRILMSWPSSSSDESELESDDWFLSPCTGITWN